MRSIFQLHRVKIEEKIEGTRDKKKERQKEEEQGRLREMDREDLLAAKAVLREAQQMANRTPFAN